MSGKKVIFSGIQPSGVLTLGNYIGALRNWVALQDEYSCLYCVVDLHAITVRQEPDELRTRCLETMALLIACGIDPQKNVLFMQSHVNAHAELAWVLGCFTYMGELNRMTQFKEKSARHEDNINAGLYTYPVLMAADILLYGTHLVPVGEDQRQHLELTRDIAIRFNNVYGDTFVVPEAYIPKVGARVMSLQEPDKKMSKSDGNPNAYITLLDSADDIARKFKRAVTDSEASVKYNEDRPGVANLISIYSSCAGKSVEEVEREFEGKGYGAFKQAVADSVIAALEPVQKSYGQIMGDKAYLNGVIADCAARAEATARRTLSDVYYKVGLGPKEA